MDMRKYSCGKCDFQINPGPKGLNIPSSLFQLESKTHPDVQEILETKSLFEYGAYQLQELSLTYSVSILMQFENST
jgi:hypothetical protein